MKDWFNSFDLDKPVEQRGNLGALTVGLEARGPLTDTTAEALALIGREIVGSGGSVVLSSRGALLGTPASARLRSARRMRWVRRSRTGSGSPQPGWHVMRMPGTDWMETATGFGASGVQQILAHVAGGTLSAQRFVPVVEISNDPETVATYGDDLDAVATGDAADQARIGLDTIAMVASRQLVPKAVASGNVGFQITRGLLGTSM